MTKDTHTICELHYGTTLTIMHIYMFFCYLFMHLVYCFKATLPVCVQVIPLEFSYVQSPYFDALMGL